MKKNAILSIIMLVVLIMISACKSKSTDNATTNNAPADSTTQNRESMQAPKVETDANGIITLAQCPTEYEGLKVVLSNDITEASIYRDDQLLQTISGTDDEPLATDGDRSIHFMDANFDGYVDIFIGAGQSRTYSTLVVWNPEDHQFNRIGMLGEPMLQNFTLHPESKSVFEGGSASAFANYFSRSVWENNTLKTLEELIFVNDADEYEEYDVDAPYTIKDSEGQTLATFSNASELPQQWRAIVEE